MGEGFDAEAARLYAEGLCTRAAALGVRMIGVGAPDARRMSPGFDYRQADAQCRTFLKVTAGYKGTMSIEAPAEDLLRQGDGNPLMLRCENRAMGKVKKDVIIECCFIPIAMPSEETGLLQFFVTLFGGVPEMYAPMTKQACEYCNDFSALGSLGFSRTPGRFS